MRASNFSLMIRLRTALTFFLLILLVFVLIFIFLTQLSSGRALLVKHTSDYLGRFGVRISRGELSFLRFGRDIKLSDAEICYRESCFQADQVEVSLNPLLEKVQLNNICPVGRKSDTAFTISREIVETAFAMLFSEALPVRHAEISLGEKCRTSTVALFSLDRTSEIVTTDINYAPHKIKITLAKNGDVSVKYSSFLFDKPVTLRGTKVQRYSFSGHFGDAVTGDALFTLKDGHLEGSFENLSANIKGWELNNLTFGLTVPGETKSLCPTIHDVSVPILGGVIRADRLNPCLLEAPQKVIIEDLPLDELTEVYAKNRIKATGKLDASGEVVMWPGPSVAEGRFEVESPGGRIQYVDEAESLPVVARDALKDFVYSRLSGEFDFSDGNLNVSARIEGRSVLLDTTRPVHINVNLQEQFGDLLKLMKMKQDVEKSLQSQGLI